MNGIFIKDLEMPKKCSSCPCCDGEWGECNLLDKHMDYDGVLLDCPLEKVKHGKLIKENPLTDTLSCSICKKQIKGSAYNTWLQKSERYADGETYQLCRSCLEIVEKYEGKYLYQAVLEAKKEIEND